jgi:hypothetical protein
MKKILINFYNWLVKSSVNPEKTSLTIKGFLSAVVFVLAGLGINYTLDVNTLTYSITELIQSLGLLISTLITTYGLLRKIYNTLAK